MSDQKCPACYDSFSGPWCDNCDEWPCVCLADDAGSVTYTVTVEGSDDRSRDNPLT